MPTRGPAGHRPRWGVLLHGAAAGAPDAAAFLREGLPGAEVRTVDGPAEDLAGAAREARWERVLLAGDGGAEALEAALAGQAGGPTVHRLDLRWLNGRGRPDPGRLARLVRAAVDEADAWRPAREFPLRVGRRVLIAADGPEAADLAGRLQGAAELIVYLAPEAVVADPRRRRGINRGRLAALTGRLGRFRAELWGAAGEPSIVEADQVVVLGGALPAGVKSRTGVHRVPSVEPAALDAAAAEVRGLMGDFAKPEHVVYDPDICAGGAAGMPACGDCIAWCPYDAVARDPGRPLRIRVDHAACEGCGACTAACPTGALRFTDPAPAAVEARLGGILAPVPGEKQPPRPVVAFHCERTGRRAWEAAAAGDAGPALGLYPVEVPCLRYVSEREMLGAVAAGAAGVALLGCEACPNGERTLLLRNLALAQEVLERFGLGGERLRLVTAEAGGEHEAGDALNRFAEREAPPGLPPAATPVAVERTGWADTLERLIGQTGAEPGGIRVPAGARYGFADVDDEGCTLCRSCATVCPTHAFRFGEDPPRLLFRHVDCVGCGLCVEACPENVIRLRPELYLERDALEVIEVARDRPATCVRCGRPHGNRRILAAIEARMAGHQALQAAFAGRRRELLQMCPDCRGVTAMTEVSAGWRP